MGWGCDGIQSMGEGREGLIGLKEEGGSVDVGGGGGGGR